MTTEKLLRDAADKRAKEFSPNDADKKAMLRLMVSRTRIGSNGCIEATIGIESVSGYARIGIKKRYFRAHRFVWESIFGPVPQGKCLDHLCRNRKCVNPEHLEIVTGKENTLRGIGPTAVNAKKSHCQKGHELSGNNLYISRGHRYCRACRRKNSLKSWHKTRAIKRDLGWEGDK